MAQAGSVVGWAGRVFRGGGRGLWRRSCRPGLGVAGLGVIAALLVAWLVWLGRLGSAWAEALGPFVALIAIVFFFAAADQWFNQGEGGFWTVRNLRTVAAQTSTVAVAALGMTLIIIAGGIDLSAGTALALAATVMASILKWSYSAESWQSPAWAGAMLTLAVVGCVAAGVLAGAVNGLLISSLRVVPFIITLGTMTAFLGLGKVLAANSTVRPAPEAVPAWLGEMVTASPNLEWLAYPLAPNFAWGVWLALALALLLGVVLHQTVFGRHVYAVGSNELTARLCGVPVGWVKVQVYSLAGLFVGAAGVYQFARLSSGSPTSGTGLELKIIAAVVIGGGSLNGGRGSVIGTLAGAAIMQTIAAGCTALGLSNPIQDIIIGVIIITAVALDRYRGRGGE